MYGTKYTRIKREVEVFFNFQVHIYLQREDLLINFMGIPQIIPVFLVWFCLHIKTFSCHCEACNKYWDKIS